MSPMSSTRGVAFAPQHKGLGFAAYAQRVAKEVEQSYRQHVTGQERYLRAYRDGRES
jgi:hypothetical protein